MEKEIIQFGTKPKGEYVDRPGAYAVVYDDNGKILTLNVHGSFHLPGGGIDLDENPKDAVIRETFEEAGCKIADVQYIGRANQYLSGPNRESLNKHGIFYTAKLVTIDEEQSTEADHFVRWLEPDDFLKSNTSEFAKWAVKKSLK
jgi:8-oxo-dGTP diphosphatase